MADLGATTAALRERGYRITPQRQAILQEVLRTEGHITPLAVARSVQRWMPAVNASTVYRTLEMLEEAGVVRHAHLERGAEYHRADESRHVHLTCSMCGAEDDLSLNEAESLERVIQRHRGFRPDLGHFAISGLCASCQRRGRPQPAAALSPRRRTGAATPARGRRLPRGPG